MFEPMPLNKSTIEIIGKLCLSAPWRLDFWLYFTLFSELFRISARKTNKKQRMIIKFLAITLKTANIFTDEFLVPISLPISLWAMQLTLDLETEISRVELF